MASNVLEVPEYCLARELVKSWLLLIKKFWLANSFKGLDDLEEPEILLSCSYVMKTPTFGN